MSNLPDGMLPGDESQADDPLDQYRDLIDKKVSQHDCDELHDDNDFRFAIDVLVTDLPSAEALRTTLKAVYETFRECEAQRLLKADKADADQCRAERRMESMDDVHDVLGGIR